MLLPQGLDAELDGLRVRGRARGTTPIARSGGGGSGFSPLARTAMKAGGGDVGTFMAQMGNSRSPTSGVPTSHAHFRPTNTSSGSGLGISGHAPTAPAAMRTGATNSAAGRGTNVGGGRVTYSNTSVQWKPTGGNMLRGSPLGDGWYR